jgi:hypothetical protein
MLTLGLQHPATHVYRLAQLKRVVESRADLGIAIFTQEKK